MHALEGKSLPKEFRNLLLSSTLREVVRDTHARGRDDDDEEALHRVVLWGSVADEMRMDEAVREEILSTVVSAHIRLREYNKAEEILAKFDRRGYRSGPFLRGFMLRRQSRYDEAIPFLKESFEAKKWDQATLQELACCYQKLAMKRELKELVEDNRDQVYRSASLLDFKIGTLIAAGRIPEAERDIRKLRVLPENDGRASIREAQIPMQRDGRYEEAERVLSSLVDKRIGDPVKIKNHQLSWWFDGEPLKAVLKDSATFGMGLWDH